MTTHTVDVAVRGPWSLATSRAFWEGFAPASLRQQTPGSDDALTTVFRVDADWSRAETTVRQTGQTAVIAVSGDGDLDAAAAQVARFLALDIDGRAWPDVAERDAVIAEAQRQLPGFRPCGFHSPYEAAAWAVLSQRIRTAQASKLRGDLMRTAGDNGAFPAPSRLVALDLDLPGRKADYLRAVAGAALDGRLDGASLRAADPVRAFADLQSIKGIGPFAAQLILVRGANPPDAPPRSEPRLDAVIERRYGAGRALDAIAAAWRPFRTWAAVHLRALGAGP